MSRMLALMTDAYGGHGGIAQAGRDLISAIAAQPAITAIDILPRHVPDAVKQLPWKVRQHRARPGKHGFAARALTLAARRPQLILCNHLYMAPLAALIARFTGAKLMIQLHGIEIWAEPSPAQRRALERAHLLLCVSRDTRERVLAHADIVPERAIVLNNTVGPQFAPGDRLAARAKFGLGDEFVILTTGRMDAQERYKGHDQIIAALPRVAEASDRTIRYVIAGDGDDRPRLEQMARVAGIEDRVRFLGRVPPADLPDLYRAADLFCLPSSGEGFGIAFLEAMSTGTPALGAAVGGAPDALGEGELGAMMTPYEDLGAVLEEAIRRRSSLTVPELHAKVLHRFGPLAFKARVGQALSLLEQVTMPPPYQRPPGACSC